MRKLIAGGLAALGFSLMLAPTASASPNEDTVAAFTAAVDAESARWNLGYIPVSVEYIADTHTIAETDGRTISLNSQWAVLPPYRFNALIAEDIANGFTPGGCAGIQALAIHEVGHVIDRNGGRVARSAVASSGYVSGLHTYAYEDGTLNPGEAVAISFQAVECGSATAVERQIYNVLVS